MGERLTEGDMDRLEQWIGKGPKTFTLLYAITRDGCNVTAFHQKCDNQGPTVTVLYNQQGSVYGGYASTSWNGTSGYVNTTDSFLFQLQYNSSPKVNKFTLKQDEYPHSIYCHASYGPTFGRGHDLIAFNTTANNSGGYFPLNGYVNIGYSYDNQGITKDQINNGNMNVTELEIYRVTDGQRKKLVTPNTSEPPKESLPWRKTKTWNEQFLNELTEKIVSFRPVDDVKVTEARILMIGPVGAGKSSFYNTINSVFRGRITNRASSGSAEQSLTTTYIPYNVKVQSGASLNFRLCDTRGLEESAGISDVECNFLLDGNIPDYYQFSLTPISLKTPGLKFDPTPDDQIHCAVFVLDSTTLDVLSPKIVEKMKGFKKLNKSERLDNTMGGRLTEGDMDILEQWIGKGPKTFTLLYAITRDGCNATTFHQKCDNQGPTVTVLYNQQGSVYGGYASTSWNGASSYVNTTDSFLFQLKYNNSPKVNTFALKQNGYQYSIYCPLSYGPTFGGGHDLHTFSNTVNNAGGYFPLNGNMNNIGHSYDNHGITKDQINNGNMNVTELEVYRVADGQRKKQLVTPKATEPQKENLPWRKTKTWNEQLLNELTEEIVSFKPVEDVKVTDARILMIGPVGAGKSSFYNTIDSIFRGRITHRACSGSADQSLTTAYTPYKVKVRSGASLNFRLCDTRGLEETTGLGDVECNYLLDGNIPDYYQFNATTPISPKTSGFKSEPAPNDQIHCVVFVLDSTTLEVISSKLVEKIKGFQKMMSQRGIPQILLLTKIDKLCKEVEKDISKVFKSEMVGKHVEKAAEVFGLPRSNVLPVKNYENEDDLDDNINILALLALRRILHFAEDHLHNLLDKNVDLSKEMEKLKVEK